MNRMSIAVATFRGALWVGWAVCSFAACGSESEAEQAQMALAASERGISPVVRGSVSTEQLARLTSPDPVPPPYYPNSVPTSDTLSRDAYERALLNTSLTAIVVRIDASTVSTGGSILAVTTLAGPGPHTRRLFVFDGVECAGGVVTVGATVLTHIAAGDASSSDVTRIQHTVMGGAIAGLLEARVVSPGVFEVSFPWGPDVVRAVELGGAL